MEIDPMQLVNIGGWAAFALWNAIVLRKAIDKNTEALNALCQRHAEH